MFHENMPTSSAVGRSLGSNARSLCKSLSAEGSALGNFCVKGTGCFLLMLLRYFLAFSFRICSNQRNKNIWDLEQLYLSTQRGNFSQTVIIPEKLSPLVVSLRDQSSNPAGELHFYQGTKAFLSKPPQKCNQYSIQLLNPCESLCHHPVKAKWNLRTAISCI